MKNIIASSILAIVSLLSLPGCNTVDSVQPGKGEKFSIAAKSYDQVWKASVSVMSRQLTIIEDDKSRGFIRSESKAGMMTYGEVVGVFITPTTQNAGTYTIEVVSLKRNAVQITGQDWTRTIITGIKAELGQ